MKMNRTSPISSHHQRTKARKRTDVMTMDQRSKCMSHIRGKDTGPEIRLRRALRSSKLSYRTGIPLPGKPDIVLPNGQVAIFVDGCFWHKCPLHFTAPKAGADFWAAKILSNVERDQKNNFRLRRQGWSVLRFWEHEVADDINAVIRRIRMRVARRGRG